MNTSKEMPATDAISEVVEQRWITRLRVRARGVGSPSGSFHRDGHSPFLFDCE